MKTNASKFRRVGLFLLWLAAIHLTQGASFLRAHQLDEYVSLTHIAIDRDRVRLSVSLTPGAEILDPILARIDRNGDGAFSAGEQRSYAERFVEKLALAVDDERPALRLVDHEFPDLDLLRVGRGVIRLTVDATIDPRDTGAHSVFFANNNSDDVTVHVIGLLMPDDSRVRIRTQERDWLQRQIRVSFDVAPPGATMAQVGLGALVSVALSIGTWVALVRRRGGRGNVLARKRAAS